MTGKIEITVEKTYEKNGLPTTHIFKFKTDSKCVSIECWVDLFDKILQMEGLETITSLIENEENR